MERGWNLVSGGTDNHLILADLQEASISGKDAAVALEKAGIVVNANTVPYDPAPPFKPSGIRLGTPALTTRGMKEQEMKEIGGLMADIVGAHEDAAALEKAGKRVSELTEAFPIPDSFVKSGAKKMGRPYSVSGGLSRTIMRRAPGGPFCSRQKKPMVRPIAV